MDREVTETVGGGRANANHRRIRKYREVETVLFTAKNPLDVELIKLANEAGKRRGKSVQDTIRFLTVLTLKNYCKTLDGKLESQSADPDSVD